MLGCAAGSDGVTVPFEESLFDPLFEVSADAALSVAGASCETADVSTTCSVAVLSAA